MFNPNDIYVASVNKSIMQVMEVCKEDFALPDFDEDSTLEKKFAKNVNFLITNAKNSFKLSLYDLNLKLDNQDIAQVGDQFENAIVDYMKKLAKECYIHGLQKNISNLSSSN